MFFANFSFSKSIFIIFPFVPDLRNRVAILELLNISGGRNLQAKLMTEWLAEHIGLKGLSWSLGDIESVVRRMRTMVAHMRDYKRSKKDLPPAYAALAAIMNTMYITENDDESEPPENDSQSDEPDLKRRKTLTSLSFDVDDDEPVSYDMFKQFVASSLSGSSSSESRLHNPAGEHSQVLAIPTPQIRARALIALSSDEGMPSMPSMPTETISTAEVHAMMYGVDPPLAAKPVVPLVEPVALVPDVLLAAKPVVPPVEPVALALDVLAAEPVVPPVEHVQVAERVHDDDVFGGKDDAAVDGNDDVAAAAELFDPATNPERMPFPPLPPADGNEDFGDLVKGLTASDALTPQDVKAVHEQIAEEKEKQKEEKEAEKSKKHGSRRNRNSKKKKISKKKRMQKGGPKTCER